MTVIDQRLRSHRLANPCRTPHEVVSHLAAVQAQDYLGALWAVGIRTRDAVESDVERAIAERQVVRCWPMRGTLHFVAAEDVRWMLELLAPRVLKRHRTRLERDFGLDARVIRRCADVAVRALEGGRSLTRPELYAVLERARIDTGNGRGLHILFVLAHERVVCFGARRGKQPTFVLLDEWLPPAPPKPREEAMHELARRYVAGHGPATAADFAWWSGLTLKEATTALDGIAMPNERTRVRAEAFLLPPFDEYTVAYKDRSAIVAAEDAKRVNVGGGMISAVVVVNGRVAGNWKRTLRGDAVEIEVSPVRSFTASETRLVERAASRYGAFLGRTVVVRTNTRD